MEKQVYHVHHIIPKHAGGTDDPRNLVKLTVEEHAEAHRLLWEEHGRHEDKVAWLSLSSAIGREEIFVETSRIGGLNNTSKEKDSCHKENISESILAWHTEMTDHDKKEMKKKISNTMKGNTNSAGHTSEEYKKKQSQAMKEAWARRKAKNNMPL